MVSILEYKNVCTYVYVCGYKCVYMFVCKSLYIHKHINTNMHTHIYHLQTHMYIPSYILIQVPAIIKFEVCALQIDS